MPKISLLLALFIVSTYATYAQYPVITPANNPVAGDWFQINYTDNFSVGSVGSGLVWNFDTLGHYQTDTLNVEHCVVSSHCPDFPGSTLTSRNTSTPAISSYFTPSSAGIAFNGAYNTVSMTYTNPEDLFRYPFTFNSTFKDTFASVFTTGGYTYRRGGTVTVTADAYGTLRLPYGTFPNALRVKTTELYDDSTTVGGAPYAWHYNTVAYAWYVPGYHVELLNITRTYRNTVLISTNSYYTLQTPVGIPPICTVAGSVQLFPNPATNDCIIRNDAGFEDGSWVSITGIDGREVARYPLQGTSVTFQVGQLAPGLYHCHINNAGHESQVMKLVVAR
jgi:hypothetical protein